MKTDPGRFPGKGQDMGIGLLCIAFSIYIWSVERRMNLIPGASRGIPAVSGRLVTLAVILVVVILNFLKIA